MQSKAIVTMISGGDGYVKGAKALRAAIAKHMPDITPAIMVEDKAYSKAVINNLTASGYEVHVVPPIRTKACEFKADRWPRTFTKLNLWNLPYDQIVYMDADACPFKPFDALFTIPGSLAATHVIPTGKRFNSGMMVLKPNAAIHAELVDMAVNGDPVKIAARLGDQGVLNVYFKKNFMTLPDRYNYRAWQTDPKKLDRPTEFLEGKWCDMPHDVVIGHLRPTPWSGRQGANNLKPYIAKWNKYLSEYEKLKK